MLKIYRSKTGVKYNLLFQKKDGTQVQLEFRGSNREYRTRDEEIQKALEGGKYFKEKKIEVFQLIKEDEEAEAVPASEIVVTSVTDIQAAADILIKDYGIKAKDLKTPEAIKAAAKQANVSFPNVEFK
ncbi:MAG: hypothetical protein LBV72_00580 [Tannerella sp.]|jgi:hypothetical protein|nr:hypothetical protein [Tannerella sp.]